MLEIRAPIQSSEERDPNVPSIIPSSHHPTIPPSHHGDPFIWSDMLSENNPLGSTHVAITFYKLYTAHFIERILVDVWTSRFAAGRNQAPLLHHPLPSLHGNESEVLDAASADLTNKFQLVNTRQGLFVSARGALG